MTAAVGLLLASLLGCEPEAGPEISGQYLGDSGVVPADGILYVHFTTWYSDIGALKNLASAPPQIELREVDLEPVVTSITKGIANGQVIFALDPVEPLEPAVGYEVCVTPGANQWEWFWSRYDTQDHCSGADEEGLLPLRAGFVVVEPAVGPVVPDPPAGLEVAYSSWATDPETEGCSGFDACAGASLKWKPGAAAAFPERYAVYREVEDGFEGIARYGSWLGAGIDFFGCCTFQSLDEPLAPGVPHVLRVTAIGPTGLESAPSEPVVVALLCSEPGVIEAQGDPLMPPPADPEPEPVSPDSGASTAEDAAEVPDATSVAEAPGASTGGTETEGGTETDGGTENEGGTETEGGPSPPEGEIDVPVAEDEPGPPGYRTTSSRGRAFAANVPGVTAAFLSVPPHSTDMNAVDNCTHVG